VGVPGDGLPSLGRVVPIEGSVLHPRKHRASRLRLLPSGPDRVRRAKASRATAGPAGQEFLPTMGAHPSSGSLSPGFGPSVGGFEVTGDRQPPGLAHRILIL